MSDVISRPASLLWNPGDHFPLIVTQDLHHGDAAQTRRVAAVLRQLRRGASPPGGGKEALTVCSRHHMFHMHAKVLVLHSEASNL